MLWDFGLLQEVGMPNRPTENFVRHVGGHTVYFNTERPDDTALLVHRRWEGRLRRLRCHRWAMYGTFENGGFKVTVGTVHLPTAWDCDVEALLSVLSDLATFIAGVGEGDVFLGIDTNTPMAEPEHERTAAVWEWLGELGLRPILDPGISDWTHEWLDPRGVRRYRVLDTIVSNVTTAKARVASELHIRSDHRPILATMDSRPGQLLQLEHRQPGLRRWRPAGAAEGRRIQQALRRMVPVGATCEDVQRALEQVSSTLDPYSTHGALPRDGIHTVDGYEAGTEVLPGRREPPAWADERPEHREVGELQLRLHETGLGQAERRRLQRRLWRVRQRLAAARRRDRFRRAACGSALRPPPLVLRHGEVQEEDQQAWGPVLTDFMENKFKREGWSDQEEAKTLAFWESQAACERLDGHRPPLDVTFTDFLETGKQVKIDVASGRDGVPG